MDNELEIVSNETLTATEEVVKTGKINQYLPIVGGTIIGLLGGAAIFYAVTKLVQRKKEAKLCDGVEKVVEPSKDEEKSEKT